MDSWREQALENRQTYGEQSWPVLALATIEEAGELAQALLQHEYEDGDPARVTDELRDLAALGYQLFWKQTGSAPEVAQQQR